MNDVRSLWSSQKTPHSCCAHWLRRCRVISLFGLDPRSEMWLDVYHDVSWYRFVGVNSSRVQVPSATKGFFPWATGMWANHIHSTVRIKGLDQLVDKGCSACNWNRVAWNCMHRVSSDVQLCVSQVDGGVISFDLKSESNYPPVGSPKVFLSMVSTTSPTTRFKNRHHSFRLSARKIKPFQGLNAAFWTCRSIPRSMGRGKCCAILCSICSSLRTFKLPSFPVDSLRLWVSSLNLQLHDAFECLCWRRVVCCTILFRSGCEIWYIGNWSRRDQEFPVFSLG